MREVSSCVLFPSMSWSRIPSSLFSSSKEVLFFPSWCSPKYSWEITRKVKVNVKMVWGKETKIYIDNHLSYMYIKCANTWRRNPERYLSVDEHKRKMSCCCCCCCVDDEKWQWLCLSVLCQDYSIKPRIFFLDEMEKCWAFKGMNNERWMKKVWMMIVMMMMIARKFFFLKGMNAWFERGILVLLFGIIIHHQEKYPLSLN